MVNVRKTARLTGSRVLVTGGAGFLGSEVVAQLSELGAEVTVLDNFSSGKIEYISNLPHVKYVKGDIRSKYTVQKCLKNQEFVIHLAALPFIPDSYYAPEEFFDVNVGGTIRILREIKRLNSIKRVVVISSSEVYGTARYIPMDENHPTLPHSTYAVSKLAADRVAFTMHKEHGIPVVIIRPFNTYGPRITQPYIIPEIALQLLRKSDTVTLGNTNTYRDFTFVQDTAEGILSALITEGIEGEVINLASGSAIKIEDLVHIMAGILGKKVKIEQDESRFRPYDVDILVGDNRKAKRLLNWEPKVPLEKGLKITIEWISNNLDKIHFKTPFKGWPKFYRNK